MTQDITDSLTKGAAGMAGSILAVISAAQDQFAWGLGVLVAISSLVSISFDIRRKWRNRNKSTE